MNNRIKNPQDVTKFRDIDAGFIVSARAITPDVSVIDYLKLHYIYVRLECIEQVFGTVTMPSRLYGGRTYQPYHSLTEKHLVELAEHGIGVGLNLTNHFFDRESYEASLGLLERFHVEKNAVIITNDELAENIRTDFPKYTLKASIIKNITTLKELERAYRRYDQVTLPMDKNDDDAFLKQIPDKKRVILFANANCAYSCPARTCYLGFSQHNRGDAITSGCSRNSIPRLDQGLVFFDAEKLSAMGFSRFKLIPLVSFKGLDQATRYFSWKRTAKKTTPLYKETEAVVISYPKSGRTWLRFILANYFNALFGLNLEVDLHNFFRVLPNDITDPAKGLGAYAYYDHEGVPLIPFSHAAYDPKTVHPKAVFLIRSPYAVVVSDYFQQTEHLGCYKGSLKDFIRDPTEGILKFCRFLKGWSRAVANNNYRVLSYEEMTLDIGSALYDTLQYLGIERHPEMLRRAIEKSGFEHMQRLEKERGMASPGYDRDNRNALRMREGKVGGYRAHMDSDDLRFVRRALEENLDDFSKHLLVRHHCLEVCA